MTVTHNYDLDTLKVKPPRQISTLKLIMFRK